MKPWLHLGSRFVSFVPVLVAIASGCSSSSGGPATTTGGSDSGGDAAAQPVIEGTGPACTPTPHETVGAKITLKVNWPQSLANAGCVASHTPPCSGDINIWLLSHYDVNGKDVTGTVSTCGNDTPPIPLSGLGSQSEGLPAGQTATVQIGFDPSVWANIMTNSKKAPFQTTGTLGGWNVGSSLTINPTNTTYGLADSSPLQKDTAVWPASQSGIPASDIIDDDNDMHPGITATPSSAMGFSLPATAAAYMAPYPPKASKLYVVLRTELSLYGISKTCTDADGTAEANLLNNHVIGCQLEDGTACDMTQWDFIDQNTTVYIGDGVKIPVGVKPPSFAPPQIHGTFKSKILAMDADAGAAVDCAAVKAALP